MLFTVIIIQHAEYWISVAEVNSWIICDGDIDPEWIESLNSVLDDNRLLTMPSGERIQFGPNINFLFETHDLSCASPATISRMGMIFLRLFISCFLLLNSRTLVAQTSLRPWKLVRDMGSSSHWGLIMVLGQEANDSDLGKSFQSSLQ